MKESREWEIDSKNIESDLPNCRERESGQASIEFLRETLDGSVIKFKQLQRAKELQSKKKRTPDEENFLATLAKDEDLVAFLPNTKEREL